MTTPRLDPVTLASENRYEAPLKFVHQWLTDFREDDGRYFGMPMPYRVERSGHVIRREQTNPMGVSRQTITIESDARWVCDGTLHDPSGALVFTIRIVETLHPEENGTCHRVEIAMNPANAPAREMLLSILPGWEKGLAQGFADIARDIRAAHAAGKSPVA